MERHQLLLGVRKADITFPTSFSRKRSSNEVGGKGEGRRVGKEGGRGKQEGEERGG
jgi:hypothetical protein